MLDTGIIFSKAVRRAERGTGIKRWSLLSLGSTYLSVWQVSDQEDERSYASYAGESEAIQAARSLFLSSQSPSPILVSDWCSKRLAYREELQNCETIAHTLWKQRRTNFGNWFAEPIRLGDY